MAGPMSSDTTTAAVSPRSEDGQPTKGGCSVGRASPERLRGLVSLDSENSSSANFLRKDSFLSLPEYIFQQYDTVQSRSFMGIFPEINRVWISIDNRLYLWNYEDNGDNAINTFDDQEQIIISAALVKPIPDRIEYVLVVATPLEIILLGIAFSKKGQDGSPRGAMTIYRTDMSIASDGVNMTSIVGTDTGRIFMRGNNGQLYELEYESQDGWLVRKIRKINRTSSGIISFIPTFLLLRSENAVKFVTVDNSLGALYIISPKNDISIYSLGSDGKGMTRVATISDLFLQTVRFSNFIPQSALDERTFDIVSMHPISSSESLQIHLVAVTSTGIRLYFSSAQYNRMSFSTNMSANNLPTCLRLVFARGPPVVSQGLSHYNAIGSGKIHEAFYTNGLLIAAQSFTDELDRIIGVSLNSGMVTQSSPMYLSETCSFADVDGKTWAIAEAPTRFLTSNQNFNTKPPGIFLNELAMQFEYPARRFFLLTNMGLSTISKLRPVDLLLQLLKQSTGQDLRALEDFFVTNGKDQSCTMSLGIACGHSSIKSGHTDLLLPAIVALATRLFFEFGGKPTLAQSQPLQSGGGPLGVPVSTFEVRNSAKHNGLALYLTPPPTPDTRPAGVDPEAWKNEQESLANMHELIRQSIETISFVSLLIDYKLPSMIGSLGFGKRELQGFTFEALVSTVKGRDVGKMLMASLVNKQIEKEIGVELITATLQSRCPSICQTNEVVFYKGMEYIQKAKQSTSRNEQLSILGDALNLFLTVVKHIHFEKLRTIIENFKSLFFFSGVIDLALAYAAEQDAIDSSDMSNPTSQSYYKRIECYNLIFSMFESIDTLLTHNHNNKAASASAEDTEAIKSQVLARALASSDQAFHTSLYDWFIQRGLHNELLRIQSPYLEDYLVLNKGNLDRADYLWQFYVRNNRFSEAARVLSQIAQSPGLTLLTRIEYLTKAVTNAKSSAGLEFGGNQELLNHITDELDVTRLQFEIYNRISAIPEMEHAANELNHTILDVNMLYHHFAKPYQMNDVILSILHMADHGIQARTVAESAWASIMLKTKEDAIANNRSHIEALSDKIKELGRKFYPDENVFPLGFLVNRLEQESYENDDGVTTLHNAWVVDALRGINVPFITIFRTFHDLFETKLPPWSSNKALVFLIQEIHALLDKWLEHVRTLAASSYEREEFPARTVDEAISRYLVTIHEDETQLVDALHKIQSKLRRAF
ncbi:hypothetical protein BSLG_003654 [Batrachochytrium salamandrivorans]|nr:hypothetical protein BSLG_003654 [Batrachochytrium salamandrivorans]